MKVEGDGGCDGGMGVTGRKGERMEEVREK